MRATKKHYGSDNNRFEQSAAKTTKPAKARKGVKIASAACAGLIACAALIIPTTTLAPNVDAYEDSRVASFSIGGLDQFSAAITNNCAQLTTVPGTEAVATTAAVKDSKTSKTSEEKTTAADKDSKKSASAASEAGEEAASEEKSSSASSQSSKSSSSQNTKATKASKSSSSESSSSSSNSDSYSVGEVANDDDDAYYDDGVYAVSDDSYYSADYLIDIGNPDYSYSPSRVSLSSYDRAKTERLVMGEAGSMGYLGCALVAQAIRDAMNRSNTTSIDQIISQYQYFGSTSIEPNIDVKNAVSFIFDQNGSAVQHRVICFYTGSSSWHETQTFITQVDSVRFFDLNA